VHRSKTLVSADCTRRKGIPVTKPARTLKDLRRILPSQKFSAALRQAEFLDLPIGCAFGTDHTRSELEARFLALVRRHRLPQPEVNVRVDRFVVDFLWHASASSWRLMAGSPTEPAQRSRKIAPAILG
jgi:hypothetical protein